MKNFPRHHRALIAAASLSVLLTACSTNSGGAPSQSAPGGANTPHMGGTLTIAVATDPVTINMDVTDNPDTANIHKLYGNGLLTENGQEEIEPSLASSWQVSSNGLDYTFNLRHDVKWQDGVPFTSADVVFSLEKFLPISPFGSFVSPKVSKVSAEGPYTVVVELKARYDPFVGAMVDTNFMIEPEHVYVNHNVLTDSQANDHPIGTGPFIFKSWIRGQKITLVRNPHYWGATKNNPIPWISKIVVDEIPSPATTVDALLNGSIDYVPDSELPTTAIKQLMNSSCCRAALVHDTPSFNIIFTNMARAPFNNVIVRRALYMAMNRNTIMQDALSGYATPPLAPIPPTYAQLWDPSLNLMTQYPYNPAKAAQMLDQAGYPVKNGERFGRTLTLLYSSGVTQGAAQTAAIVKAELAQININVQLIDEDLNTWAHRTYVQRNFDLSFIGYTSANDPASGAITLAFACQPNRNVLYTNPSGYCNKTVDSLFQQAAQAGTAAERQQLYAQAFTIVDNELPAYEVGWRTAYVGISRRIQNWQAQLSGGGSFAANWAIAWLYPLNG
jgi:peptide/nickel transport system substrate-binding protein